MHRKLNSNLINRFRTPRVKEETMIRWRDDFSNFSVNQHHFVQVHGRPKREKSQGSVHIVFIHWKEKHQKKILFRMSHRSGIPVTPELDKAISETRAGKYRLLQVLFKSKVYNVIFSILFFVRYINIFFGSFIIFSTRSPYSMMGNKYTTVIVLYCCQHSNNSLQT